MTDNTYPDLNAADNIYQQNKAIIDAAAKAEAMDALIAEDVDLYNALADLMAHKPDHADTLWQNASDALETASARIKGDKDRLASRAPPLEYDHTQDGTANFERAFAEIERLMGALERANAQTEQFERDYYLKCDEQERDRKDAAAFMGKRDADMLVLTELAHQYLSDLRYPPSPDSKERRIERINAVLKEVQP